METSTCRHHTNQHLNITLQFQCFSHVLCYVIFSNHMRLFKLAIFYWRWVDAQITRARNVHIMHLGIISYWKNLTACWNIWGGKSHGWECYDKTCSLLFLSEMGCYCPCCIAEYIWVCISLLTGTLIHLESLNNHHPSWNSVGGG